MSFMGIGFGAGTGKYRSNAVRFNGTDTWLTRGGDLTGVVDSKILSFSCWVRKIEEGACAIYRGDDAGVDISIDNNEAVTVTAYTTGGATTLFARTSNGAISLNTWYFIAGCFDVSDSSKFYLMINDTSAAESRDAGNNNNNTMKFSTTDHMIGSSEPSAPNSANLANMDVADLYVNFGNYVDYSDLATRRKFIDADGKPVDLWRTGNKPTGSPPILFFSGVTNKWHTNKGTGGGFTENGTLTTSATSLSD